MKKEEAIEQAEGLKCHCEDMAKSIEENSIWKKDIEALSYLIELAKRTEGESKERK